MKAKYYILKRYNRRLAEDVIREFPNMDQLYKQIDSTKPLLLIEKIIIGEKEFYRNIWSVEDGCEINWQKYVKGRLMYDYTGVVNPLIHLNGEIMTWKTYSNTK
jgi:hypothetical protein